MKTLKYIGLLCCLLSGGLSYAQVNKIISKDTSISLKVYGECSMCKERIEKAVKGRGVRSASWDTKTKQLSLAFDPSITRLDKIENRILSAGHDLENKKAKDAVYNALPECCHYRTMEIKPDSLLRKVADSLLEKGDIKLTTDTNGQVLRGVVLESNSKGAFTPLLGASVMWVGTNRGAITDISGVFGINTLPGSNRLVVSYSGYTSDTLTVTDRNALKIILASNKKLSEVVITGKIRSTYISTMNPLRIQTITEKELFKAACCNLSESFETNPSVDVSYNDAVTGSKQIQLLGLSGNYTQLTVENLPGPRGLATALGLNSIAGPWVESIQLTKGIGSVANGYESIAGQINVELKKPENTESLFANAYINDFGKTELNLNLAKKFGDKWSGGLLLHDDFFANKNLDINHDGFRDLPTGNQFSMINRWKYDDNKGFMAQFGLKVLNDRRTGGETAFNENLDKNTTHHYGLGINTDRYEFFSKTGYVFPGKKYKSIGLQLSATIHHQDSYFGLTEFVAKQQQVYSNLLYQSIINNTNHKFRTGLSILYDDYNEDFKQANYKRKEIVPGAFFEYTNTHTDKFNLVAGLRADQHNLFGLFITPRIHIRYEPVKGTTIRLSAGRGQRTANIFAENNSVFVSSRQLTIINAGSGKAYGLDPEVAWNKGISIDHKFRAFNNDAVLSIDFFRNDFNNQVVVDLENAREVKFYNLSGSSYSNSFQAELNVEPVKQFNLRLAYRYFDVKTSYSGKLLQRPLIAPHRAFANLAYAISNWKFDYTISYNGTKRIPATVLNPVQYQLDEYSPAYVQMNAQVSKTIGKKLPMEIYVGMENLGNYFQKKLIIAPEQPFGPYFDASMVYAPVSGRMLYAGWRVKIK